MLIRFGVGHAVSGDMGQVRKVPADGGDVQEEDEPVALPVHQHQIDVPAIRVVRGGLHHVGLRAGLVRHGPLSARAGAGRARAPRARPAASQLHTQPHQELRPRLVWCITI